MHLTKLKFIFAATVTEWHIDPYIRLETQEESIPTIRLIIIAIYIPLETTPPSVIAPD